MRILLIEDDYLFGSTIKDFLTEENDYVVDWAKDGNQVSSFAKEQEHFDLVILDLELAKFSWRDWLKNFRAKHRSIPILVLSGSDEMPDTLNAGVDHYLPKRFFSSEKLSSAIHSLLRRSDSQSTATLLEFKDITMNLNSRIVTRDGKKIDLGRREFSILHKLLTQVGQVVKREQLTQSLYGWERVVSSNTIEVHISQLRWKLNGCFLRLLSSDVFLDQHKMEIRNQKEMILLKGNSVYQIYYIAESGVIKKEVISQGNKKLYNLIDQYQDKFTHKGHLLEKADTYKEMTKAIYKFVKSKNGIAQLNTDFIKTISGIGYTINED